MDPFVSRFGHRHRKILFFSISLVRPSRKVFGWEAEGPRFDLLWHYAVFKNCSLWKMLYLRLCTHAHTHTHINTYTQSVHMKFMARTEIITLLRTTLIDFCQIMTCWHALTLKSARYWHVSKFLKPIPVFPEARYWHALPFPEVRYWHAWKLQQPIGGEITDSPEARTAIDMHRFPWSKALARTDREAAVYWCVLLVPQVR